MEKNSIIFFFTYFVATLITILINTYLPIYFVNYLQVDLALLSTVQLIAYSGLVIKIIYSFYLDKSAERINRKLMIILSSFLVIFSFFFLLISAALLIIFAIFFTTNLIFLSILDATIDKIVVASSNNENERAHNALYMRLGAFFGNFSVNLSFFILYPGEFTSSFWTSFFIVGVAMSIPLCFVVFLLDDKPAIDQRNEKNLGSNRNYHWRSIFLVSIFYFLISADQLYQFVLEPWLVVRFGEETFSLISIILIILSIVLIIGVIVGKSLIKKFDKKSILIISSIISGINVLAFPYLELMPFIIDSFILNFFGGIILITLTSTMIQISKGESLPYQIIGTAVILAKIVFIPFGTLMLSFWTISESATIIFIVVGVLYNFSIAPLIFINLEEESAGVSV